MGGLNKAALSHKSTHTHPSWISEGFMGKTHVSLCECTGLGILMLSILRDVLKDTEHFSNLEHQNFAEEPQGASGDISYYFE